MSNIHEEIRKKSLDFIRKNKSLKVDYKQKGSTGYLSPRVSSEFMDCSMPMTFDSYSHCSLGCAYCFAYQFKTANSSFREKLHTIKTKALISALRGKPIDYRQKPFYEHFYKKRFLLHWGGLADPFCNFEKTNEVGYEVIQALAEEKYPTLFSFKGSAIFRPKYVKLFEKYADQKNFAFQISIIAPSDEMSRKMEIGVPVTSRRIDAMKMLSDMGYYTILRLRPYIIGVTDDGIDELLHRCKEAGMRAISMEFMAIDARSNFEGGMGIRYKWLGELIGTKDIMAYFKALSPSERGSYMRLNRMVKEPYVKKVFQFCLENDVLFACSDPDFKELNMSGSCCGMPDNYPENRELENWTKNQLTYAVKEARKIYHQNGRIAYLKFNKVFKPDEDTYLRDQVIGQDHPRVKEKSASERHIISYLKIARESWNNMRSPSNPRNYFHGKISPIRYDENGDVVYVYEPSEYEARWANEGIDMKR